MSKRSTGRAYSLIFAIFSVSFVFIVESWAEPVLMVSGRWDNTFIMVDLEKALDPANDSTSNAILNRVRYTPDAPDGRVLGGQGINLAIPPNGRFAYAIDHGRMSMDNVEAFYRGERIQHGFDGYVVVFDLKKALDPANDMTLNAVDEFVSTGGFGATGIVITEDGKHAFIAQAEEKDSEDGGRYIKILDLEKREVIGEVEQALGNPGFPCPPNRMPVGAPDLNFGCFPDTNGMVYSPIGGGYIFTGNGGTEDVGVIDVQRALAGDPGAEIFRIPVQTGPFGVGVSPDGKYVASANRESQRTGKEGNTISIIDVEKAIAKDKNAEVARVLVGTNDPGVASRPFHPVFIDGGKRIIVSNFRANNVSIVDVEKAIKGEPSEVARIPIVAPKDATANSKPRGITVFKDGRYAAITGDGPSTGKPPKLGPDSSVLYILDLQNLEVVSRVTGVGNEAYFTALVPDNIK